MTHLRKARAGSSSHGYSWPEDGQAVEVADEHVAELLAIRDAGFTVAEPEPEPEPEPMPVLEPAPADPAPVLEEAPAKPATRARKTTTRAT